MTPTKSALIVSLALNLILVGIFAGAVVKHSGSDKHASKPHTPPGVERLSEAQRLQARDVLREAFDSAQAERDAHIAAREALLELFSNDPLPHVEIEAALATLRLTETEMRARMQGMLLEDLSTLSPEVRAYIIQRMLGRGRKNRPKRGPERQP